MLILLAWPVHELRMHMLPTWPLLAGPLAALLYTLLCGRDYSFVGCAVLSLIVSSICIASVVGWLAMNREQAAWGLSVNVAYLCYIVYDTASLMARRRFQEPVAAVTDLYRDVFNIFGYTVRVVGHWRRHRIWANPK